MVEGSGGVTALLGMDGFVVLAMDKTDGEWWLLVETSERVAGCPDRGVRAVGHGRSTVQVRDLPNGSGAVRLVWLKRRWRCPDPDCERKTFVEQSELVEGSLTRRVRVEICRGSEVMGLCSNPFAPWELAGLLSRDACPATRAVFAAQER
jgi:hypothetical protein